MQDGAELLQARWDPADPGRALVVDACGLMRLVSLSAAGPPKVLAAFALCRTGDNSASTDGAPVRVRRPLADVCFVPGRPGALVLAQEDSPNILFTALPSGGAGASTPVALLASLADGPRPGAPPPGGLACPPGGVVTCLASSPCGRLIAAGSSSGLLAAWRTDDGAPVGLCPRAHGGGPPPDAGGAAPADRGGVGAVAWSADAGPAVLVSGGADGRACVWDPRGPGGSMVLLQAVGVGGPGVAVTAIAARAPLGFPPSPGAWRLAGRAWGQEGSLAEAARAPPPADGPARRSAVVVAGTASGEVHVLTCPPDAGPEAPAELRSTGSLRLPGGGAVGAVALCLTGARAAAAGPGPRQRRGDAPGPATVATLLALRTGIDGSQVGAPPGAPLAVGLLRMPGPCVGLETRPGLAGEPATAGPGSDAVLVSSLGEGPYLRSLGDVAASTVPLEKLAPWAPGAANAPGLRIAEPAAAALDRIAGRAGAWCRAEADDALRSAGMPPLPVEHSAGMPPLPVEHKGEKEDFACGRVGPSDGDADRSWAAAQVAPVASADRNPAVPADDSEPSLDAMSSERVDDGAPPAPRSTPLRVKPTPPARCQLDASAASSAGLPEEPCGRRSPFPAPVERGPPARNPGGDKVRGEGEATCRRLSVQLMPSAPSAPPRFPPPHPPRPAPPAPGLNALHNVRPMQAIAPRPVRGAHLRDAVGRLGPLGLARSPASIDAAADVAAARSQALQLASASDHARPVLCSTAALGASLERARAAAAGAGFDEDAALRKAGLDAAARRAAGRAAVALPSRAALADAPRYPGLPSLPKGEKDAPVWTERCARRRAERPRDALAARARARRAQQAGVGAGGQDAALSQAAEEGPNEGNASARELGLAAAEDPTVERREKAATSVDPVWAFLESTLRPIYGPGVAAWGGTWGGAKPSMAAVLVTHSPTPAPVPAPRPAAAATVAAGADLLDPALWKPASMAPVTAASLQAAIGGAEELLRSLGEEPVGRGWQGVTT